MATWVRQSSNALTAPADSDLEGTITLDNGTAPSDFDPDGVTAVDFSQTITGSGFVDDTWTHFTAYRLETSAAVLIAQADSADWFNYQNESATHSTAPSSATSGLSIAQWESARVVPNPNISPQPAYAEYVAEMKADGGVLSTGVGDTTITITYTPATPQPSFDQDSFLWRNDDGNEAAATPLGAFSAQYEGPTLAGTATEASDDANPTSLTFAHTLVAGLSRKVIVSVAFDDTGIGSGTVSTVTYGGQSMTLVTDGTTSAVETVDATNRTRTEVWAIDEANLPADGSNNVVITMSEQVDAIWGAAQQVDNVKQGNVAQVVTKTETDGGVNAVLDITTTNDDRLLLSSVAGSASGLPTVATPWTLIHNSTTTANSAGFGYLEQATAGTASADWTWGGGQARVAMVNIEVEGAYINRYARLPVDTTIRLRALIQNTNANVVSKQFKLQYRRWGVDAPPTGATAWGAWTDVGGQAATTLIRMSSSGNVVDGAATTQQLGVGTFTAGVIVETDSTSDAISVAANAETEVEWCIQVNSGATNYHERYSYEFRVVESVADKVFDTYTNTPTANVLFDIFNDFDFGFPDGKQLSDTDTDGKLGATKLDFLPGASGTFDVDTALRAHGGNSILLNGVSGTSLRLRWDDVAQRQQLFMRGYFYLPALPSNSQTLMNIQNEAGSTQTRVNLLATGALQLDDETTVVSTTSTVSTGQWIRIEHMVDVDGNSEVRLFNSPESVTPTDSVTASTAVLTDLDQIDFLVANFNEAYVINVDEIAIANDDWIGPKDVVQDYGLPSWIKGWNRGLIEVAGTSVTIQKPDNTAENDLMYAVIMHEAVGIVDTPPAGWTDIGTVPLDTGGGNAVIYQKTAGASEPSEYTFSFDISNQMAGIIVTVDGTNYSEDAISVAAVTDGDSDGDVDGTLTGISTSATALLGMTFDDPITPAFPYYESTSGMSKLDETTNTYLGADVALFHEAISAITSTTETFTTGADSGAIHGILLVSFVPVAGGQTIAVGTLAQSDSPVAIQAVKPIDTAVTVLAQTDSPVGIQAVKPIDTSVGVLAQSDSLIPVDPLKPIITPVGSLASTDTLIAVQAVKPIDTAVATLAEADTLNPVTIVAISDIGTIAELETLIAANPYKTVVIGVIAETETSLPVGQLFPQTIDVTTMAELENLIAITGIKVSTIGTLAELDTLISVSGIKIAVLGIVSETDTLQPIEALKPIVQAIGTVAQSDSLVAVDAITVIVQAVATLAETETLQLIDALKPIIQAVSTLAETDALAAVDALKPIVQAVGTLTQTDTLIAVEAIKSVIYPIGTLSETEVLQSIAAIKAIIQTVSTLSETESLIAVTAIKPLVQAVGTLAQSDSLITVDAIKAIVYAVSTLAETDALQAVDAIKAIIQAVTTLAETETLIPVDVIKPLVQAVGTLGEVASLIPVGIVREIAVGTISEIASLIAIQAEKIATIGTLAEIETLLVAETTSAINRVVSTLAQIDTLIALGAVKAAPVGTLAEVSALIAASPFKTAPVGTLAELDNLLPISRTKIAPVGTLAELENLLAVAAAQPVITAVGTISQSDLLLAVQADKPIVTDVGVLGETDALQPIVPLLGITVGTLAEIESLIQVDPVKDIITGVGTVAEIDTLLSVSGFKVVNVGTLSEFDSLISMVPIKAVGTLAEIDDLLGIPAVKPIDVAIGTIGEVDTLVAVTVVFGTPALLIMRVSSRNYDASVTSRENRTNVTSAENPTTASSTVEGN